MNSSANQKAAIRVLKLLTTLAISIWIVNLSAGWVYLAPGELILASSIVILDLFLKREFIVYLLAFLISAAVNIAITKIKRSTLKTNALT